MKTTLTLLLFICAIYAVTNCGGNDPAFGRLQGYATAICTDACVQIEGIKRTIIDTKMQQQISTQPKVLSSERLLELYR